MMSIYPTAVGHWLATVHCLCFWLLALAFFFLFFFCFSEIPGFCIGTRHRGDWRGRRYLVLLILFLFLFNCTILARLSVGTLGFIKLDTILYRSYFDITTRLWGLDYKLHCGNTFNLIAQNATTGFCLLLSYRFVGWSCFGC